MGSDGSTICKIIDSSIDRYQVVLVVVLLVALLQCISNNIGSSIDSTGSSMRRDNTVWYLLLSVPMLL